MGELLFILSDDFPYELMIPPDSGPQFARNLDLICGSFGEIEKYRDKTLIIDTKISREECNGLLNFAKANADVQIILKLGDPYELQLGHFTKMAFEMVKLENVKYLSSYSYKANTKEIADLVGESRILCVPYAFNNELVSEVEFNDRKEKIILSGARFKHFYPLRRRLMKQSYRFLSPALLKHTDVLKHPGYPDIGDEKQHSIIGSSYIEYLAQYKFMLVTPSVYDIELLKYVECAYAGCVPVGEPASSLPAKAKELVQPITMKRNIGRQIRRIIKSEQDYTGVAKQYYLQMKTGRDKKVLRQLLQDFALK